MDDHMDDLFLRAARGETTERRPVWMMRQAGRYLPEYRAVRARVDFLGLCRSPELVTEVTLQPLRRFGMDAAILFADILLPLEAMGAELQFVKGDGPTFPEPIRSRRDISRLRVPKVEVDLGYVFEGVKAVRQGLAELDRPVPLVGFAGTPWTLAAYLVQGGSSPTFPHLLAWSWDDPEGLTELLDRIADVTIEYLLGQVEAGAQALQLFDTWGGLLDAERWRRLARPSVERILSAVEGSRVPRIYFAKGTGHLLEELATLPLEVLSVDWRQPLSEVRRRVGDRLVLQGNLDPTALLAPIPTIEAQVDRLLAEGSGGGHIVNLGHGILPMTPPEHAGAFIRAVQTRSARSGA